MATPLADAPPEPSHVIKPQASLSSSKTSRASRPPLTPAEVKAGETGCTAFHMLRAFAEWAARYKVGCIGDMAPLMDHMIP